MKDLYIFPECFFIRKAKKRDIRLIFTDVIDDVNLYFLINEREKEIFIINFTIKYFLEKFRKPDCLTNVAKKIKGGILPDGEIHSSIKKIFPKMVNANILISANYCKYENSVFNKDLRFPNFNIIQVLKKNKITTTAIALDTERNTKVVIKFLSNCSDKDAVEIFQHEFKIMNKIGSHSLIRSLISFDKEQNIAILEYIKGRTLEELILIGKLKMKHKLFLAYQIIKTVSILHEKDVIHGDIHTNQFLVEPNLNVKIIDFGNSISYLEENVMTMKGGACNYLEPEIVLDDAFVNFKKYTLDFRMDVYRLGVLIYFLMYEKYPFDSVSWKRLCKIIRTEEPELNSFIKNETIPAFVITILKKSLSKESDMRFHSASDILAFFNKEYETYTE
jgi:serine/threonine protein kinase